MHFDGYDAHVRIPLGGLSATLTYFGISAYLLPINTRKEAQKGAIFEVYFTWIDFTCLRVSICFCLDYL